MTAKRVWMWMLAVGLVAAAALPVRAQQVELPASAVTEDTTLAIWLDAEHLTPEAIRQSVDRINAILPEDLQATAEELDAQLEAGMAEFGEGYTAFTEAGGEGVLMLMRTPAMDAPRSEPAEPSILVRVAPGTTAEELNEAMQPFAPEDAPDTEVVEYAEGWMTDADTIDHIPTDGDAAEAAALAALLENTEAAPVRLAMRVNEPMREQLAMFEQQAQGQGGGMGGPNPGAALLGPAQHIDAGWGTLTLGEDPAFRHTLSFDDADEAEEFRAAWSQLLMMGQQMFQMQFAQPNVPNAPEPASIQGLFDSLELERDGAALHGEIGDQFITHAAEIIPAIQPMLQQMLGPGMGGPGQMGPPQGQGAPPQQPMPPQQ